MENILGMCVYVLYLVYYSMVKRIQKITGAVYYWPSYALWTFFFLILLQSPDQNRLLKHVQARQKKHLPPPKEFVLHVIQSNTSLELEQKHHPPRAHN